MNGCWQQLLHVQCHSLVESITRHCQLILIDNLTIINWSWTRLTRRKLSSIVLERFFLCQLSENLIRNFSSSLEQCVSFTTIQNNFKTNSLARLNQFQIKQIYHRWTKFSEKKLFCYNQTIPLIYWIALVHTHTHTRARKHTPIFIEWHSYIPLLSRMGL